MTCRCSRSEEACWRQAVIIDALRQPVCRVCWIGCGELRFGAPSELFIMCKVIAAHTPMRMEYQP
jgi:hypothetical protein